MLRRVQQHRLSTAGKKLFPSASKRATTSPGVCCNTALPPSVGAAHGRVFHSPSCTQTRRFGSFLTGGNNEGENWYRHSLRTVVADLKQELEQEPEEVVPGKALNPIQSLRNVLQGRATPSSVNHSFSLLDQLVEERKGGRRDLDFSQLNTTILNALVGRWKDCWGQKTSRSQKGFELLSPWVLMEKMDAYQESFPELLPNTETYNCVISVASQNYNNEDEHQLGLFVQSVVEQMETQANHEGSDRLHPNPSTYNILVQTWARAGNIKRIEGVITSLESWSDIRFSPETIDAVSKALAAQLEAISKIQKNLGLPSLPNDDPKVASDLKEQMEDSDPKEELRSLGSTAPAVDPNLKVKEGLDPKEDLLLIQNWIKAKSGEGVSKAFQRLDELLLSKSRNENVPTFIVRDLLTSWARCWEQNNTNLQPEQVMEKVLAYHDQRNGFRLDTRTFNTLMKVLSGAPARSRHQGLSVCRHLFKRMEQDATTPPDSETYIRFIMRSAGAEDIQGCLNLLVSLLDHPRRGKIWITATCFERILKQCFRMEGYNKNPKLGVLAERILDLMAQLDEARILVPGSQREMVRIYSIAIRCWEASGHPESPTKVKELVQKLEQCRDTSMV